MLSAGLKHVFLGVSSSYGGGQFRSGTFHKQIEEIGNGQRCAKCEQQGEVWVYTHRIQYTEKIVAAQAVDHIYRETDS